MASLSVNVALAMSHLDSTERSKIEILIVLLLLVQMSLFGLIGAFL
jgi:hypothetical protein